MFIKQNKGANGKRELNTEGKKQKGAERRGNRRRKQEEHTKGREKRRAKRQDHKGKSQAQNLNSN